MDKLKETVLPLTDLPLNIQGRLPMYGSIDVLQGDELTLKRNMTAYIIMNKNVAKNRQGGLTDDGWTRIQQGSKFIFGKIMEEGTYEADDDATMYLFNDVQYGINLELIYKVWTKYLICFYRLIADVYDKYSLNL